MGVGEGDPADPSLHIYGSSERKPIGKGVFEVRWHPLTEPDHVKLCHGWADTGIGGWYVVIDNGGIPSQWGRGLSCLHPDGNYQHTGHGAFDQHLTPVDDLAKSIMAFVEANKHWSPR